VAAYSGGRGKEGIGREEGRDADDLGAELSAAELCEVHHAAGTDADNQLGVSVGRMPLERAGFHRRDGFAAGILRPWTRESKTALLGLVTSKTGRGSQTDSSAAIIMCIKCAT
jgi:hypothetical protein